MPYPTRPSARSPLSHPRWYWAHHRWPRATIALLFVAIAAQPVFSAEQRVAASVDEWSTSIAWVVQQPVGAGEVIAPGAAVAHRVPELLRPADATNRDPSGQRAGVGLVRGEVIRAADLATVPAGTGALELQVPAGHLDLGDLVDLYDLLSGERVAVAGLVVGMTDERPTIAINNAEISRVVRSLTNGEVVPVLVS